MKIIKKLIEEIIHDPEFSELKDYPLSWIDRVLTTICREEGLPTTMENKLKFLSNLESDLESEFHGGIRNMMGRWIIRRIIKAIAGSQKPGARYYRREATGNPERPWKYYYTKEASERAHGKDKEHSGEAAKAGY